MRPLLITLVLGAALTIAGSAAAVAPSNYTVYLGTLTHGDGASLGTVDGDTFDVVAKPEVDGIYYVYFEVAYPSLPGPFVHYTAWGEGGTSNCKIGPKKGDGSPRAKTRLKPGLVRSGVADFTGLSYNVVVVSCRGKTQYTVRWDRLSLEGSA
jgi:hypothetical protein